MTELLPASRTRRYEADPRGPWAVLVLLVVATALVAWHPLFAVAVPACCFVLGRLPTPGWWVAIVLGLAVALSPILSGTTWADPRLWAGSAAAAVLAGYLPWLVGRHLRDRADLDRVEAELVAHLEQRQWELATRTRLRERARIAQEMHDTLGHQLSLIALRAGALEVGVGSSSSTESQVAEELRIATTRAAEQLGEIVGLLADSSEPLPRQPGPEDLEALVRRAADAGMDVELTGSQSDLDGVPLVVARAALRVVQEGLTNAAKHAAGASVRVSVERSRDEIVVAVVDDGVAADHRSWAGSAVSGGRGLAGLTDRMDYVGGRLSAEPVQPLKPDAGGFALTAHLPTTGPQPPAVADEGAWSPGQQAELMAGRRRTHRSWGRMLVAPLGLLLVIAACFTSYFVYVTIASVLSAEEYARIEVGSSREDVEAILPPVEMLEPPTDRLPAPTAPGATCSYYEGEVSFFERRDVYRICFADGMVTDTDVVPAEKP